MADTVGIIPQAQVPQVVQVVVDDVMVELPEVQEHLVKAMLVEHLLLLPGQVQPVAAGRAVPDFRVHPLVLAEENVVVPAARVRIIVSLVQA